MFFKKSTSRAAKPKHVEAWGHLVDALRFHRRLAAVSVFLAFAGMATGAYGMIVAVNRPLVFHVDGEGRARAMGRVAENRGARQVEVRYVTKRFLRATMAFHSDTIEADLANGWNLMTDAMRGTMRAQFDAYARERGEPFVAFVKKRRIRTLLQFRKMTVQSHNDNVWSVKVRGVAKTWPLNRVGEDAEFRAREFDAQLTVVRAPRTETTPNGLLVSAQATKFYEVRTRATRQENQVGGGGPDRRARENSVNDVSGGQKSASRP